LDEGTKTVFNDGETLTGSKTKKLRALFGFLFEKSFKKHMESKDKEEQDGMQDQEGMDDRLNLMSRNITEKDNDIRDLRDRLEERNNYMINMDNELTDMSNELDHLKRELEQGYVEIEAKQVELNEFKDFHERKMGKLNDDLKIEKRELEKWKSGYVSFTFFISGVPA
jgi:chromosome segregation ATPase